MTDEKKKKHKLLIELIFRANRRFSLKNPSFPVQNQPFELGLLIKNNGDKVFPGCVIKNLKMSSLDTKTLGHDFNEEFSVSQLNPGGRLEIWVPKPLSTYLEGPIWLSCSVIPNDPEKEEIETCQYDKYTGVIDSYKDLNRWGNAYYIRGKFELEQSKTNQLVLILTALTFLEGLIGIKKAVLWVFGLIGGLLLWLLTVINRLPKQ